MQLSRSLSLTAGVLLAALSARADVKLPALVSDNMVLLQDSPANVWGWAAPMEKVTVTLGAKSAEAVTDEDGKWSVKLEGLQAGVAGDLTVAGKNTLTVKNVAVGEVWVASGQSNMEMSVQGVMNAPQEIAQADFPQIRMFTVSRSPQAEPQEDCTGKWEICTPATVPHFSAVGYFFARHLEGNLHVPIGIIHSSWGGTPAQLWTPVDVLAGDPDLESIMHNWETTKAAYPQARARYDAALLQWKTDSEAAKAAGSPVPPKPRAPAGGERAQLTRLPVQRDDRPAASLHHPRRHLVPGRIERQ